MFEYNALLPVWSSSAGIKYATILPGSVPLT